MISASIRPGIQLHILPEKKFNTIVASILFRTPLQRQTVTEQALLAGVLKRGSKKYPNHQLLYEKVESLYGAILDTAVLKKGEQQLIQGYVEVLKDPAGNRQEPMFWDGFHVLMDVMFNPCLEQGVFVKKYVEMEKKQLGDKINARMNNKKEYALNRLIEEMCGGEPFSLYGDGYLEDLEKIEPNQLYETYRRLLTKSTVDIVIIGDVKQEPLQKLIQQYIFNREPAVADLPVEQHNINNIKQHMEEMDVSQGKLCMGLRAEPVTKGPEYYALMVLNSLLGGGSHSLLFQSVREKNSLCYYVNSMLYRFKSIIAIQSGIQPDQYEKTVALIKDAIQEIKDGHFKQEDLASAKEFLLKQFDGIGDYPSSMMDFYMSNNMAGDRDTVKEAREKISAVEKQDILKIAATLQLDTIYFLKGREKVEHKSPTHQQNS